MEDRIDEVWRRLRVGGRERSEEAAQALQQISRDLKSSKVPYDEWEVLFREKLLVERGLLEVMAGLVDKPEEPVEIPVEVLATTRPQREVAGGRWGAASLAVAAIAAGLFAWQKRGHRGSNP